jgi:hypothetical protein
MDAVADRLFVGTINDAENTMRLPRPWCRHRRVADARYPVCPQGAFVFG